MTTDASRHTVVIVTSSYPRFPGDLTGTAVEPIARGIGARGHAVHVVAPWHPLVRRGAVEDGIHYHFYRYAPVPALNVFGYAGALRADVSMKWAAYAAAPFAFVAGVRTVRRVVREHRATLIHAHWAIPSGAIAAAAAGDLPLVISLHGSDIFVAERNPLVGRAARRAFGRADRVTGCSADLRDRAVALGAADARAETLLHGVDADRFTPSADTRARVRATHGIGADDPIVFAVGRLVRKKGFEYLIDAVASLAPHHAAAAARHRRRGRSRCGAARAGLGGRRDRPRHVPRVGGPRRGRGVVGRRRHRGGAVGGGRRGKRRWPAQHRAGGARVRDAGRGDAWPAASAPWPSTGRPR